MENHDEMTTLPKNFNLSIGIIISMFDGLFGGLLGACVGAMFNSITLAIATGICFALVMLVLDFRYSVDEL